MKKLSIQIITLSIVLSLTNSLMAQKASLSGALKDSSGHPLVLATAGLYKLVDKNVPVKTTYTTKTGVYRFDNIDTGHYLIRFSFSGYAGHEIPVTVSAADRSLALADVYLQKSTVELKAVTVTSKKQLIEIKDDGLVYNAEADPMARSDKLIDLLRKTPMVTVDADNNVLINGQSNFRVLLNGRETSMFARNTKEALKAFPGALVSRIEIITSPSAKYDAEGVGGIINVITRKKILGYNASVSAEANTLTYRGANASLNMKYGKLGITAFTGFGGNNGFKFKDEETILALTPAAFHQRTAKKSARQFNNTPEINMELAYELDSLNTITLYGAADKAWREDNIDNIFTIVPASQTGAEQSFFKSFTRIETPGWSIGTDYIHKFKTSSAKEFSLKLFASSGKSETYNNSDLTGGAAERFVLNESRAKDRQYTIQADYVQPLGKKQRLDFGLKAIIRRASSNYQSYLKTDPADDFALNPANSDNFSYRQNVYSVYASYSFSIKKFNFRTGLRAEHTTVNGDFVTSQTSVEQDYTNLAPNFLVATQLKSGHHLSFTYSLRVNRPYISSLNPFVDNIDSLFVSTGNPGLTPQISHVTNFSYRFAKGKTFTNINLGNSYSSSYILYGYLFDKTSGVTTSKPFNGGVSNITYLTLGINASPLKNWQLNTNTGINYILIKSRVGLARQNSGFAGNIGLNSSYNITPKLTATANFNYYFPVVLLQGSGNRYYSYGMGSRYNFLKSKLTATMYVGNLFLKGGSFKTRSRYEDESFRRERVMITPFRSFGLGLTWNFGKLSEGVSKKRGVQNNDLL